MKRKSKTSSTRKNPGGQVPAPKDPYKVARVKNYLKTKGMTKNYSK
jgi:hypothetical protein